MDGRFDVGTTLLGNKKNTAKWIENENTDFIHLPADRWPSVIYLDSFRRALQAMDHLRRTFGFLRQLLQRLRQLGLK